MQPVRSTVFARDQAVELCVERVCRRGCAQVRQVIALLEAGAQVPETRGLGPAQRQAVLDELRAVMAVYDARL